MSGPRFLSPWSLARAEAGMISKRQRDRKWSSETADFTAMRGTTSTLRKAVVHIRFGRDEDRAAHRRPCARAWRNHALVAVNVVGFAGVGGLLARVVYPYCRHAINLAGVREPYDITGEALVAAFKVAMGRTWE